MNPRQQSGGSSALERFRPAGALKASKRLRLYMLDTRVLSLSIQRIKAEEH